MRHPADRSALAYVALHVALMALNWTAGGHWGLAAASAILAVGITCIAHNHAHLPIWRSRRANRLTDVVLSALLGIPVFVFRASHNAVHHRGLARGRDPTSPWRFGDDNHLPGFLAHPFRVLPVVVPHIAGRAGRLVRRRPRAAMVLALQCLAAGAPTLAVLAADPERALVAVLLPQWIGLHMLLGANYLQHAQARGTTASAQSRNFLGQVNAFWFNIGYHTAHHGAPRLHWSLLPARHRAIAATIPPELLQRSLRAYAWRQLVLAPLARRRAPTGEALTGRR